MTEQTSEIVRINDFLGSSVAMASFRDIEPSRPQPRNYYSFQGIEFWGKNNLAPQLIYQKAKKNTVVMGNFRFAERAMNATRLQYGKYENGVFVPKSVPEIDKFIRQSNLNNHYLPNAARDLAWWYWFPAEFILSADRKKIVSIEVIKTMYCRFEKMANGKSKNLFVNANWEYYPTVENEHTLKVPILETYGNTVENLQKEKGFKYIYPVVLETNGELPYPEPHWFAIDDSGILDIVKDIWESRAGLLKNGLKPQYMIKFANWYFPARYPEWERSTPEQRKKIFADEFEHWSKIVQDNQNSWKTFATMRLETDQRNTPVIRASDGIEIVPIESYIKNITDSYLADNGEASQHISFAMGIDPTLIGNAPGSKMGAGSGSDKREAFNMYLTMLSLEIEKLLEPLNFALAYNGFPDLEFRLEMPVLQTKDQITPNNREIAPPK